MSSRRGSVVAVVVVVVLLSCWSDVARSRAVGERETDLSKTYRSVMESVVAALVAAEGDQVSIPDVSDEFGGFWLNGRFSASGGLLGNLSTLALGDVTCTRTGSATLVTLRLSMDPLEAAFSHFRVSTRLFSTEGSVTARVLGNVIDVRLRVVAEEQSGACAATLDHVTLADYQDIDITSLSVGSRAEELFVWSMLDMAKSLYVHDIVSTAEAQLTNFLNPYMLTVCDLLSQ